MLLLHYKNEAFFQRLRCLEMNMWICRSWNWFIPGARKCSLLRGGYLQLASAASKAGDAGRRGSVGKVPREGADSQLPLGSFCERSTPWVVHRSYFTLGTYHAFGNWHVRRYMLVLDVRTAGSTSWHLLLGSWEVLTASKTGSMQRW